MLNDKFIVRIWLGYVADTARVHASIVTVACVWRVAANSGHYMEQPRVYRRLEKLVKMGLLEKRKCTTFLGRSRQNLYSFTAKARAQYPDIVN